MPEWKYHRLNADRFMLALNLPGPVPSFEAVPEAVAMRNVLREVGEFKSTVVVTTEKNELGEDVKSSRDISAPGGPLHKIAAWRGTFTVGGTRFRIMSMFGQPKTPKGAFLILSCDTLDGDHNEAAIRSLLDDVSALDIAPEEDAPQAAANLRYVAGEVGGGRFGFASETNEGFAVSQVGGSLEGAAAGGIYGLYEARPGNGTGALWLVTRPYVKVAAVHVGDDKDWVERKVQGSERWLYHVEAGDVAWPSRYARVGGIMVGIELDDGRMLQPDGSYR